MYFDDLPVKHASTQEVPTLSVKLPTPFPGGPIKEGIE